MAKSDPTNRLHFISIRKCLCVLLSFALIAGMISYMPAVQSGAAAKAEKLSFIEKRVYDILKETVVSIANGDTASTRLDILTSQLTGKEDTNIYAAELGLSAIRKNGKMTSEAEKAIGLYTNVDMTAIVDALLADLPYELFWYDKTDGYQWGSSSYYIYDDHIQMPKTAYTVEFYVSRDYSKSGKLYDTEVDTQKIASANKIVKNADAIIKAAKDKSDYEKTKYYFEEICRLASYNNTAAGSTNYPYGDPWQMIHVFDKDESTEVVCEGYAKAFKYLCDNTEFANSLIECQLVSGYMITDTGYGPHMWNLVTMDDGKIYLVDVTNCDEGAIGEGEALFLKGCPTGTSAGYTIDIPRRDFGSYYYEAGKIEYKYLEETLLLFSEEERTIAKKDYDPSTAVVVTPTPKPVASATPVPTSGPISDPTATVTPSPTDEATPEPTDAATPTQAPRPTGTLTPTPVPSGGDSETISTSVSSSTTTNSDGSVVTEKMITDETGRVTLSYSVEKGKDKVTYTFELTGNKELKLISCKVSGTSGTVPATVTILGTKYTITGIGENAFSGNKKLKKITLGKKIVTVEKNAFAGASKLTTIVITPTGLKTVKKGAFNSIPSKTVIKIKATKAKYKKIKKLIDASGLPSGVTLKRSK